MVIYMLLLLRPLTKNVFQPIIIKIQRIYFKNKLFIMQYPDKRKYAERDVPKQYLAAYV